VSKQRPRSNRRQPKGGSSHGYPRTARLSEVLREVIAEELVKIDDERLDLVTVTAIDVDSEMNRAIVYFDSMFGEEGDEGVLEALGEHRARLQATINRQMHARKTPILSFRPDEVIRSAARIEELLRQQPPHTSQPDETDESHPEQ
jgi:ribosome-binding factor A